MRIVVVGAGSAGAVIAARVTEQSEHEVTLVEAGPDYAGAIPADLDDGTRNSMRAHDWGYQHQPTVGPTVMAFPRGKVVGGSSAVNTCIALRGQPYDYDEWAARGLPEWTWAQCLEAFKRLETDLDVQNEWHGLRGPIPIRRHPRAELVRWQAAFLDACEEVGFPTSSDSNDPRTTGAGPHAMNKVDGKRMSAARCYLTAEVRARKNLVIVSDRTVRRVIFHGRRARGVEIARASGRGPVERIDADLVVLSAGAIATPGILVRSGVGPRAACERLHVELVSDVPAVGARLLDHPGAAMFLAPRRTERSGVRAYLPGSARGRSPLASEAQTSLARTGDPLLQVHLRYSSSAFGLRNDMQVQPGSLVPLPWLDVPVVTLMCAVGKPRGHGSLEIRTTDPAERPRIHSKFLADAKDLDAVAEGMETAFRLSRTRAMRELAVPIWPSAGVLGRIDRIRAWVPSGCGSGYHPCGTVPMGTPDDPDAATDGRGRVRGTEGLVVADASLMPTIPSSNTNLPTLMIGERFGVWLRET